ncbi:butyrate kinase [Occallatibacter riparius]|uniref:Probable butyrate kinase n=1 Tax=Occallatibacter riparius TaxID=1002689 RepID=A0A9J7BP98_9BACT|nr:butyrate kinase [Occallatibacter riparius]UWZ84536.1 butyrate kinase [Occallatibacter riparius]
MTEVSSRVLAINPGSTSTKVGVFRRNVAHGSAECDWTQTIRHSDAELEHFRGWSALSQADFRAGVIRNALQQVGYPLDGFAAFAGRGGLLPPMECGTYEVNDEMVEELRAARRGEHASNLGAVLAVTFAREIGVRAYIVDPVTVDEWQPCARFSGLPQITRSPIGHALNIKAVARRFARDQQRSYAALRLIVIHLGSGITVSAHCGGRMIDQNTPEEGPFGPDRSGWLPVRELIKLCFSGRYNEKQLDRLVFGEGGLYAYLETRDLQEIEHRADAGDADATAVYDAMIYKIAKEAGAMGAVLEGRVDAVVLTGGMAHSERLVSRLRGYVEWIAPVTVYPGEDELLALAEGVFRVLDGEEEPKVFHPGHAERKGREVLVLGLE